MRLDLRRILLVVAVSGLLLLLDRSRTYSTSKPDWKALYEGKLGQPISEMNIAALDERFENARDTQVSWSWARLEDGSDFLLGLSPYGRSADQIVEQTVVLAAEMRKNRVSRRWAGKRIGAYGVGRELP